MMPRAVVGRRPASTADELPEFLRAHLDEGMSEGVSWKFAPLQIFPDRYELALDNYCIMWEMPTAIRQWLTDGALRTCVFAEDVRTCLGQFAQTTASAADNFPQKMIRLPPAANAEGGNIYIEFHCYQPPIKNDLRQRSRNAGRRLSS